MPKSSCMGETTLRRIIVKRAILTDMKTIPLTKGYCTIVDDADYAWLSQWKWCACTSETGRVCAFRCPVDPVTGKHTAILMHRVILNAPKGVDVDHRDLDGLNNQRDNLRFATVSQNQMNTRIRKHNKSGFKGVSLHPDRKWHAYIKKDGKGINLGGFDTPEEAHAAYCRAAESMFGDFSRVE